MEEIKRVVFSWRRLLVLLLLGVLCLVNLTRMSSWEGLGRAEVKMEQFLENHRGEPLEQLKELLDRIVENQSRSASNNMSYGLLRNQAEYLTGFSDRLAEIQAQAENMSTVSIFAGSPYSQANIRKTAADYRRLEGLPLTLGHDRAVEQVMGDAVPCLAPGGRLAVITFHSLEDRIVKNAMQEAAKGCTCPPEFPVCVCGKKPQVKWMTRKPVTAGAAELQDNPRARSAKLRVCEKLA